MMNAKLLNCRLILVFENKFRLPVLLSVFFLSTQVFIGQTVDTGYPSILKSTNSNLQEFPQGPLAQIDPKGLSKKSPQDIRQKEGSNSVDRAMPIAVFLLRYLLVQKIWAFNNSILIDSGCFFVFR